ncbi:DEAD/DEAH box helicase, partial [Streptomyces pilosus]
RPPAGPTPAQTAPEGGEAEAKPRRTRKTAAKKAEAAVDTAEAKPRRTRKTAAAATAGDPVEAAEAKPRRTRKAAADIPAQSAP